MFCKTKLIAYKVVNKYTTSMDCIFCKIVKGVAPSKIQGESKSVIAFDSIAPVAKYHILITPKKHLDTFLDVKRADAELFYEMIYLAQKIIREKKIDGGYKLLFNGGKYQVVNHLHWHLLGGELEDVHDILNNT